MPRIELLMSLLAGLAGGLVGTLWGGTVSERLLARERHAESGDRPADTLGTLVASGLLYGACGAALGLLFWLGWGLIALVAAPWPAVGLIFGLLCWSGGALPALGMMRLRRQAPPRVVAVLAIEWLVACLAVGVLCALTWHRTV